MSTKPRYRLVSGTDDDAFCQRVSEILDDGYILYGSPAITLTDGQRLIVQALILPQPRPERHGGGDFGGPRRPFRKFDDDRGGGGGGGDFRGGDFGKDKPFGGRRPGRF